MGKNILWTLGLIRGSGRCCPALGQSCLAPLTRPPRDPRVSHPLRPLPLASSLPREPGRHAPPTGCAWRLRGKGAQNSKGRSSMREGGRAGDARAQGQAGGIPSPRGPGLAVPQEPSGALPAPPRPRSGKACPADSGTGQCASPQAAPGTAPRVQPATVHSTAGLRQKPRTPGASSGLTGCPQSPNPHCFTKGKGLWACG